VLVPMAARYKARTICDHSKLRSLVRIPFAFRRSRQVLDQPSNYQLHTCSYSFKKDAIKSAVITLNIPINYFAMYLIICTLHTQELSE
jgi:hypothetical protein